MPERDIAQVEAFPVYQLEEPTSRDRRPYRVRIDLPEAALRDYERVLREYNAWQARLEAAYGAGSS